MVPRRFLAGRPSESDLVIHLINGSEIWVVGLDRPERIEGPPWDGCVITEIANIKKDAWQANIRPALSDRRGWAWLEGVPEGRNFYYHLDRQARAEAEAAIEEKRPAEWGAFWWKSGDILPPEEIEAARRDLDELTFQQEYEASFVNFTGRAYYPFDTRTHCASLEYDKRRHLILCFDFNVAPGVAVICQEMKLPNGENGTGVIGEVWIPQNSNTPAVCRKIAADWGKHEGLVFCHGDATGGARGTAKVSGSDWELIAKELRPVFGERLRSRVPNENPRQRVRINAVNSRLKSSSGIIRLMVDPKAALHVVLDLEGVRLLEGGAGEIDKKIDPEATHMTDALGYYIVREFPITDQSRTMKVLSF
uniref:Putative terminase n=1 Tax=viral metagenome TaxID=1070528 RepID=A0A6M3KYD3_9ZZZZ